MGGHRSSAPAGWYRDPSDARLWRYWNGASWTEHFAPRQIPIRPDKPQSWLRRHKLISALAALIVVVWAINAVADEDQPPQGSSEREYQESTSSDSTTDDQSDTSSGGKGTGAAKARKRQGTAGQKAVKPRAPRTFLVTRVVDGDSIELGNGAAVRIVGIDTPEAGECGYEAASNSMVRMVQGKRVRLTVSDEDHDQYGRLLRYVNVGSMDAGLQQIKRGFAFARYDSRDGYGFHVREPRYIAADRASKNRISCPKPVPFADTGRSGQGCAPGYNPCVPAFPPDVDCADVDGPIQVTGSDPHGLDAEGDGIACES